MLQSTYLGNPDMMKELVSKVPYVPNPVAENEAKENFHQRIKDDKDFIITRMAEMAPILKVAKTANK